QQVGSLPADVIRACQDHYYREQQHLACILLDLSRQLGKYQRTTSPTPPGSRLA
ncbi:unnamed protein product, partial [Amoebophrya sp. A25]